MSRLSDFVTHRKRYYNQSGRVVFISALEHYRKIKFRTYIHLKLISKIVAGVMVE